MKRIVLQWQCQGGKSYVEKTKIKLSELSDLYDIEEDTVEKDPSEDNDSNMDIEIEEVISDAEKKLEKEFREE